jgi:hyaluronoglucosaminidase
MKAMNAMGGWMKGAVLAGALGLSLVGATGTALAQAAGGASGEYMGHWAITTWHSKVGGRDLQAQIDVSSFPIKRDTYVLYESWLGLFPYAGVHLTDQGDYMARHIAEVARDVVVIIPDANFSGYGVIDYETWFPVWSRLDNVKSDKPADAKDRDFKDDWEDHMKANRARELAGLSGEAYQQKLASTYNAAAKRFYLETLRECKRLRPKTKWGFYGYPYREYFVDYAPFSSKWKEINSNDTAWLFEAVDVVFPTVYPLFKTVDGRPGPRQNTLADNAKYITGNVQEAIRVARGKPVMPFVMFKHHPNAGPDEVGKWVSDAVIRQMLELPKQAGAQGVMMWDCIESEKHFTDLRDIMGNRVGPMMRQIAVNPQAPAPAGGAQAGAATKAQPVKATKLPSGQIVVGKSKSKTKVASAPE